MTTESSSDMTSLVHGEFRPDLTAPEFVVLPDGMARADGERIITAATRLDEVARDAIKAGA